MAEVGPLCKKAEDLELLTNIIAIQHLQKPINAPKSIVKNCNIFYQENSGDLRASKVSKATHTALMKAVNHLKHLTGNSTKVLLFIYLL